MSGRWRGVARALKGRIATPRVGHWGATQAALRAASLLRGGVPAARVWRVLGEDPEASAELVTIRDRLRAGDSVAQALLAAGDQEWRVLAAACQLAEMSGASLAPVLERIASALGSLEKLAERRTVLLAGPRSTIRLMAALPPLAMVFGAILGFDPIAVLWSPLGFGLLICGTVLLVAGIRWASLLSRKLEASDWVSGLECELCWIALAGGVAPSVALKRVADSVDTLEVEWIKLSALSSNGPARTVLRTAASLGTSAAAMLIAEADASRIRALAELEREAERLGVRVLLPLGLCVLPAFVVLGVLPVLLAVVGTIEPVAVSA